MSSVTKLDAKCPQCGGDLVQTAVCERPDKTYCAGYPVPCITCGHIDRKGCGYQIDHEAEWLARYVSNTANT